MANKIKITIEEDGIETVSYHTDTNGEKTVEDVTSEIISIVGERPLRKEKR